jgi:hypothetical protein
MPEQLFASINGVLGQRRASPNETSPCAAVAAGRGQVRACGAHDAATVEAFRPPAVHEDFPMTQPDTAASLLEGSCHCGAVHLVLPSAPEKATECNCSLCRRLGGLWVYYEFGTVKVTGHPEHTEAYIWGDKTLRTVRCRHCGCVTHWEPLGDEAGVKHGVNLRNFPPALAASVQVRHLDGADTWKFLD